MGQAGGDPHAQTAGGELGMKYEVDTIPSIEPGLSYGHRWEVCAESGEVLVRGWSAGNRARAVEQARLAMGRVAGVRVGRANPLRQVIYDAWLARPEPAD